MPLAGAAAARAVPSLRCRGFAVFSHPCRALFRSTPEHDRWVRTRLQPPRKFVDDLPPLVRLLQT